MNKHKMHEAKNETRFKRSKSRDADQKPALGTVAAI